MNRKLLGIVLCGGRSARMGRDKASLTHGDGGTFLDHAIARLNRVCDHVAVSGGEAADHDAVSIPDAVIHRGPAIGIAASLAYARDHQFAACLVTPVDTPRLRVEDLCELRDQWLSENQLTVGLSDRVEPLIGIYPVALLDPIQRLGQSQSRSLSRWIESQDHTRVHLPIDRLRNINTPEDLAEYGC